MSEDDLVSLLGRVNPTEARGAIRAAATQCFKRAPFTPEAVLEVLEVLASGKGFIAVVARFAKAKLLLAPRAPSVPPPRY
ncbi:MAG: hypothetical protein QM820_35615 [Minicystis sp.]